MAWRPSTSPPASTASTGNIPSGRQSMTTDAAENAAGSQASEFRRLFEDERMRSARRVAALRAVMATAFFLLNLWFGLVAHYSAPASRIPSLGLYAALAIAL